MTNLFFVWVETTNQFGSRIESQLGGSAWIILTQRVRNQKPAILWLPDATCLRPLTLKHFYTVATVKRFGSILCSCNHRSDLRIGANPSPSHSKPLSRNLDLVSQIRGGLHLVIGTWEQSWDPWATWAPWERRPAR